MKSGRRTDSENLRRDSRDVSHGVSRIRKRPSMLSEFHGKQHYNHRDSPDHYRSHSRHSYDSAISNVSSDHERFSHGPSSVYKSSSKGEFRSRHTHSYHHNYRPSHHYHSSNSYSYHNDVGDHGYDDEVPVKKRPRLTVDVSRKASAQFDTPNSADSVISSSNFTTGSATPSVANESPAASPPPGTGGLSAYHLEDIDSDDDDTLLQNDEEDHLSSSVKSPPAPGDSSSLMTPDVKPPMEEQHERKPSISASVTKSPPRPSKEELLQMMEKVDRDIAAVETQISALQKKKAELEESARSSASVTTPTPPRISTPSPHTPSSHDLLTTGVEDDMERGTTPIPSPSSPMERRRSVMETIYSENKAKARSSQSLLNGTSLPSHQLLTVKPLYHQPSEAPLYHHNILSHVRFRPKLVAYVRTRKLQKARVELALCEEYDKQMAEWERRVEKSENSSKKRVKDFKNRELFEKVFPELKAKREQQERFTRVDQRGFGVVRSDAELTELAYELFEQEEASVRFRKTHATIPPMLIDKKDQGMRFYNENSRIPDPMALHREAKFTNIWTDEEKSIFRDKYTLYPKNFEMIASFLPNKSTCKCVKYYYVSKKGENFKQLARKASFKRKKTFVKSSDMLTLPCSNHTLSTPPHPMLLDAKQESLTDVKPTSEYGDWDEDEIECLKEGLRKFGRAWGKIYREVGGRKTATQCKQFYDTHCAIEKLGLLKALADHSSMKNAEKLQRKAESRKSAATVAEEAKKKKVQKPRTKPTQLLVGSAPSTRGTDIDSENTESASETESNSEDSGSESTITDSGEEVTVISAISAPQGGKGNPRSSAKRANRTSTSSYRTEEAVGLFISAAEALDNMVPVEIALHDHNYALPPDSLINNMDLQGSSGLSLIAAAAAVVSPSFPRSSGKSSPVLSPVRAPRGRPPNTQRRSGSNSTSKLLPNFLSPAGSSSSVLLTDMKSTTFRNRTRSAPTDRPRSTMLHLPRAGSSLTKSNFSSSGGNGSSSNGNHSSNSRFGAGGRGSSGGGSGSVLPHTYSRQRSDISSSSSSSSSLKSVISLKPPQTGTSAFEALVNVAVAAPPAELPRASSGSSPALRYSSSSTSGSSSSHSRSSSSHSYPSNKGSSSKSGATLSTLINAHHHHHHPSSSASSSVSSHKDSSTVSSTSGKTTAYIDVGQAISILASLAQQASSQNTSTPSISVQPIIGHASSSLIGSLVSQVNSRQGNSGGSSNKSASSVETLIGHLTSGVANGAKLENSKKSTSGGSSKKPFPSKSEASSSSVAATLSISQGPPANNSNSNSSNSSTSSSNSSNNNRDHKSLPTHSSSTTTPHTIQITASMDDLSNLNLLSSLVAAAAASQTANPHSSTANSGTSAQHLPTGSISYTLTNATTTGTPVASRPNSLQTEHHRRASPVQTRGSTDVASSPSTASPSIPSHTHISSDLSSGGFSSSAHYSLENDTTSSRGKESEGSPQDGYEVRMGNGNDRGSPQERDSSSHTNLTHQSLGYSSYSSEDSDNLPRSVVRTSLTARVRDSGSDCDSTNSSKPHDAYSSNSPLNIPSSSTKTSLALQPQTAASTASDMTASLASIIPPFNPSNSQQSSLLLYTHSLSFPLSAASEMATEEEDHLESATRGISELSKLLGTDSGGDAATSLNWNPADLLSPPPTSVPPSKMFSSKGAGGEYGNSTTSDEVTTKPVFSGLLESQIHGTIHHSPGLVNSAVGKGTASTSTATPTGVTTNEELEHHSR